MRSQSIPMTPEEFKLMPRKPGWKHEYYNGVAHISPSCRYATAVLTVSTRPFTSPCALRSPGEKDKGRLIAAYLDAFSDTIEYCDWAPDKIKESACNAINDFFARKRGIPLTASLVAVLPGAANRGETVVGAAFVLDKGADHHPLLDMLFVAPSWQRRGLATAMISAAVSDLHKYGIKTLQSRYMLGNAESAAWHKKFGFEEVPSL